MVNYEDYTEMHGQQNIKNTEFYTGKVMSYPNESDLSAYGLSAYQVNQSINQQSMSVFLCGKFRCDKDTNKDRQQPPIMTNVCILYKF